MAKKKVATTKPNTLAIARNDNKFTLSWKLPKNGYAKQKMRYRWQINEKWNSWIKGWADSKADEKRKTTSLALSYTKTNYYPYAGKPRITGLQFQVGGTRADTDKINYTWSGWQTKTLTIAAPSVPSISANVSTETQGKCDFVTSTSVNNKDTNPSRPYINSLFQTILLKNCDEDNGAKAWERKDKLHSDGWSVGASYTYSKTEDQLALASGDSYVRWVREQSRGAGGGSLWSYQHHSYALPIQAEILDAGADELAAGGYTCHFSWKAQPTFSRPIDRVVPQYCFAVPDAGMQCPDDASWTSLPPVIPTRNTVNGETAYFDATRFSIDRLVGKDQCLFVRANTEHDKIGDDYGVTRGTPKVATVGYLTDPGTPVYTIGDHYALSVSSEYDFSVPDAIIAVYYTDAVKPPFIVGYIPSGQSSVVVQCPEFSANPKIGVRAIVPASEPVYTTDDDGVRHYTIEPIMESLNMVYSAGGTIPTAPTNVEVVQSSETADTVRVSWAWTWEAATGVELSWSDHADAWESTDEPSTYEVSAIRASAWNISGLDAGITWYIRVRFFKADGDNIVYGPYSVIKSITPKSSPAIPSLDLSENIITPGGSVTAAWGYTTTDGTGQGYAEITTAVINAAGIFYGKYALTDDTEVVEGKAYFNLVDDEYVPVTPPAGDDPSAEGWYEVVDNIIAHTETAQHITINADDPLTGWQAGETYLLCVRVMSQSGARSDGWSAPQSITIADPLECEITSTSLVEGTITSEDVEEQTVTETVASLVELTENEPLTVAVSGAGTNGNINVSIERAADIVIGRPDGSLYYGFKGETVAQADIVGDGAVSITPADLIGSLDDGGVYKIIATITDELGQQATTDKFVVNGVTYDRFSVLWSHQAITPTATALIDGDIAKITPVAPSGTLSGDTFDIYRLSVDKPEIIVKGGTWGTTYVDPYPTIGQYGGHRVVFMTYNGDYINADSEPAWVDTDDILDLDYSIINFGGNELEVRYNMELSSSFEKSFEETTYLGGAVKGDWNAAVTRSGSIKAVCTVANEPETIEKVRELAAYAGICHVRTKDGSSYAADVQVSDDMSYDTAGKVFKFSLSVTRVDPEVLAGLTLSEWEAQISELA